jgi:hypothetical protein
VNPRPVFGCDIDGTLGLYHQHFLTFASGYLGRELDLNYDGRAPLYRWCGISKERYRRIKLAYRKGSLKRSMPAIEWASDLTRAVSRLGVDIYMCTTRPYLGYDNVDEDTRWWLRHNGMRCKGVLWGEHKYRELARLVGRERVFTVLDDEPKMLQQAADVFGLAPICAVRPHNRQQWYGKEWTYGAWDYETTLLEVKRALEHWRAKQ